MLFNAVVEKDEHGCFAKILELDGCVSEGETCDEALKNVKEALDLYLEALGEKGRRSLLCSPKVASRSSRLFAVFIVV